MPSRCPSRSTRSPVRSAPSLALPPVRSIGICPTPEKNVRDTKPFSPRPVKYSALARNVTLRGISCMGMKKWSENDRWLLARMAAPVWGTFSFPRCHGRKISRSNGASVYFRTW